MDLFNLNGKVAIVTGSSRGIGRSIAIQLAKAGAKVVISSRKLAACEDVVQTIRDAGGEAMAIAANISDKAQVEALVAQTRAAWGGIDIMVCNAATNPYYGPMTGMSDEVFDKIMRNNVLSNAWLCNLAYPDMKAKKDGAIVIVSSIGGLHGSSVIGAYNVSKAADMQLARNLAVEWGPDNIRVNCIAPGLIRTDFAKALHESSGRHARRFVAVNCAAIPESLIESELFGHLPGAFTGAGNKGRRGLVQEADGGTLFLDEIGDMPRDMQARLLRVLAEREVLPIGATRPVPVNLRVIAATNRDLQSLVRQGAFRDDLYYRLNGAQISLPPLRERRDMDWVIQRLLDAGARTEGQAVTPQLSAAARARLHAHHWPGNLRELRNVLDFARAVCSGGCIGLEDLPDHLMGSAAAVQAPRCRPTSVWQSLGEHPPEAVLLLQYLRAAQWNVTAVARQLGLSRMTLYRRMHRFGIVSPNQQSDAGPAQ